MKRFVTPNSLYRDLINKERFECSDRIRPALAKNLKRFSTQMRGDQEVWLNIPVIDVLNKMIEEIERLLWDSGELSERDEKDREDFYTELVKVKNQVLATLNEKKT